MARSATATTATSRATSPGTAPPHAQVTAVAAAGLDVGAPRQAAAGTAAIKKDPPEVVTRPAMKQAMRTRGTRGSRRHAPRRASTEGHRRYPPTGR